MFRAIMRFVPFAMRAYRFWLYCTLEQDFYGLKVASGKNVRANLKRVQTAYIWRTAPAKYHHVLIPTTEIGCKRKVMDTGYLACLHRHNVELVATDPIEMITETGVKTRSGREIRADAIILANGFKTQQILHPLEIIGQEEMSLNEYVGSLLQ